MPYKNPEDRRAYYARRRDVDRVRDRLRYVKERTWRLGWRSRNPERMRLLEQVKGANANAKILGLPGRISVRDVEHLPLVCVYCSATEDLTIEHATPMGRGGENHWSNLTTACFSCNRRKAEKTVLEFLAERAA